MTKTKPTRINGTPVEESGEPMTLRGEVWHTFIPIAEGDDRLWEWSETPGRIIQTREASYRDTTAQCAVIVS
jgi:hypothetical protein